MVLMLIDKRNSINKSWRISEKTLLFIGLFGGALGGFIGMKLFRHKTKHLSFKIGYSVSLILHIALIYNLIIMSI